MVENNFIRNVLKQLERFLIKKYDFQLSGNSYDLMLFIPFDKSSFEQEYSVVVSAKILNDIQQRDIIRELLLFMKEGLSSNDYSTLHRINTLNTEDPLVKHLKSTSIFQKGMMELNDFRLGELFIDRAIIVKSYLLEKLVKKNLVKLEVSRNEKVAIINAEIIDIDRNFNIIYNQIKEGNNILDTNVSEDSYESAAYVKEPIRNYSSKINIDDIIRVL